MGDSLAAALGDTLGGEVSGLVQLSGGASRETWAFDLRRAGSDAAERLVLQRGAAARHHLGIAQQGRLLELANAHGVPAPYVLHVSEGDQPFGAPAIVMQRVEGETIARRILRDGAYAQSRTRIVAQCAQALARLHAIDATAAPYLDQPDQLDFWRATLDSLGQPHPAFEIALRWLEKNRPATTRTAVVHGDFRLGNLVVDAGGLAAVLDWELAHAGDPLEDLGWLCVKAWRFGAAHPVAGLGGYEELTAAYEAAGGVHLDRAALHWWETLGTLKWGIICIAQADKHLSGATRSVELVTIGRRVCENEWDVLQCLDRAAELAHG